jgi:hypothetical protein
MQLWLQWWSVVAPLRQTCRDKRSFLWLCTALAGFCVRPDLLGVSSTVRALGLAARCYDRLLDLDMTAYLTYRRFNIEGTRTPIGGDANCLCSHWSCSKLNRKSMRLSPF